MCWRVEDGSSALRALLSLAVADRRRLGDQPAKAIPHLEHSHAANARAPDKLLLPRGTLAAVGGTSVDPTEGGVTTTTSSHTPPLPGVRGSFQRLLRLRRPRSESSTGSKGASRVPPQGSRGIIRQGQRGGRGGVGGRFGNRLISRLYSGTEMVPFSKALKIARWGAVRRCLDSPRVPLL